MRAILSSLVRPPRTLSGAFRAAEIGTMPIASTRATAVAKPRAVRHPVFEGTRIMGTSSDSGGVDNGTARRKTWISSRKTNVRCPPYIVPNDRDMGLGALSPDFLPARAMLRQILPRLHPGPEWESTQTGHGTGLRADSGLSAWWSSHHYDEDGHPLE